MRVPQFFDMSRKPAMSELSDVSSSDVRRVRTVQRLQIGITGIFMMVLLIGLASIIQGRAALTDATTVPEAAPTTEPSKPKVQNDPLAEAGVVPGLSADPAASPKPTPGAARQDETGAPRQPD